MNCMPMKESEQSKYYNNNIEHAKFIIVWRICWANEIFVDKLYNFVE